MDHTNQIAAFNKEAYTLTPSQRSLVRFYCDVTYGIALDKRQAGMTISAISYLLWELYSVPEKTTSVYIVETGIMSRYAIDMIKFQLSLLNLPTTINATFRHGQFFNPVDGSELVVLTESSVVGNQGLRGKRYDSMFVDNWTDDSNFARTIRHSLPDMLPLLSHGRGKLHLIGTGMVTPDPAGLIKSVHDGKSYFKMWDMGMGNRINELSIM